MELTAVETRVLGCLLEKERTTPENYPLSLHALTAACNQLTNREPILGLGEREIEDALDTLRQKKLATVIFGAGSRVQKYRHILPDTFTLTAQESALLCVLFLRGAQTPGELRQRAERMAPFESLTQVEAVLNGMGEGDDPLVRRLPQQPGQKEQRFAQLLSGEPTVPVVSHGAPETPALLPNPTLGRLDALEAESAAQRAQIATLTAGLEELRRQLGI